MVSVVLADDHKVVREGLQVLLGTEPDLRVVGESGDGLEAVRLVKHLEPDVLILDLTMPGLSGLEVARQARQQSPKTRVVILSMHANEAYVLEALQNGAAAYVLKESSATDLVFAVHEVMAGRHYLSPPLSEHVISAYLKKAKDSNLDGHEMLTNREREVLQLAAEGCNNSEIGQRLFISPRTAEIHRSKMMHKLGLRNQGDLIRYALRRGIVSVEKDEGMLPRKR